MVPTGLKTGVKGSIQNGVTSVKNLTETASKLGTARLRSAGAVITDRANMAKNKLVKDTIEMGELADTAVTALKNLDPRRIKVMETTMGNKVIVHDPAENTHTMENTVRDIVSRIDGVNIGSGTKTGATEAVNKLKNVGDDILDVMESSGGHTLDRHVGKSKEYLIERTKNLKEKEQQHI